MHILSSLALLTRYCAFKYRAEYLRSQRLRSNNSEWLASFIFLRNVYFCRPPFRSSGTLRRRRASAFRNTILRRPLSVPRAPSSCASTRFCFSILFLSEKKSRHRNDVRAPFCFVFFPCHVVLKTFLNSLNYFFRLVRRFFFFLGPISRCHNSVIPYQFLHTNIRSVIPNRDDLQGAISNTNSDLIVLTETWLTPGITDSKIFSSHDFDIFRNVSGRRGGVLIRARRSLSCSQIKIPTSLIMLWVCCKTVLSFLLLGVCYRSPNS